MAGQLAYIQFLDPGQHPDQGLPGGRPPRPGQLPSRPGRPVDPDYGVGAEHPDQGLPEPPPGIWPPPGPSHPIVPLPPESELPPGAIWPPLPEHAQGKFVVLVWISGEHEHSGWHYTVIDTNLAPDQGLPGEGEEGGEYPDQGPSPQPPRPGQRPPQPGQGLPRPPVAGQPHPGNRPPGSAPPRPGQGLPPTAQPKR
jgi:hypothetical protein